MDIITKTILRVLLNQKRIGGNHFPENQLIKNKTKYCSKIEKKKFQKEYKDLINKKIILRSKKRTGKGSSYHISLNPKKIKEIQEII